VRSGAVPPVSSDLVLEWLFTTDATDTSGQGNNGVVIGMNHISATNGFIGYYDQANATNTITTTFAEDKTSLAWFGNTNGVWRYYESLNGTQRVNRAAESFTASEWYDVTGTTLTLGGSVFDIATWRVWQVPITEEVSSATNIASKVTLGLYPSYLTPSLSSNVVFAMTYAGGSSQDASTNNATVTGTDTTASSLGVSNAGMAFNGSTSTEGLTVNPAYAFTNKFTLSAWVRADNVSATDEGIIGKWWDGSVRAWSWYLDGSSGVWQQRFTYRGVGQVRDSFLYEVTCTQPNKQGIWTHVALVVESPTNLVMYSDGYSRRGSQVLDYNLASNTAPIEFGEGSHSTMSPYIPLQGAMDEIIIFNRALTANEVANTLHIASSTKFGNFSYWESLPHYSNIVWGASFNTQDSKDWSNYGRNGNNGTNTDVTFAGYGHAVLNGSTSVIELPSSVSLNGASAVTLSAWVNATAQSAYDGIIVSQGADDNKFSLGATAGKLSMTLDIGASQLYETTSTPITNGVWNMVTMTWTSGEAAKIYVNGIVQPLNNATTLTGTFAQDAAFKLGYDACKFDDPIIWNRALSSNEVSTVYSLGHPAQ